MYKRVCPKCNKELIHKDKYACIKGIKENKICLVCRNQNEGKRRIGINLSEEHKLKIKSSMKGKISSITHPERSRKLSLVLKGKKRLEINKRIVPRLDAKCIECGIEFKYERWRNKAYFCSNKCKIISYKKKGEWKANYNPNACEIIEEYGKNNGYNFQHALNGGEFYVKELGYWVDGYDKEKNVVVEYYEKYHKFPKQKKLDIEREEKIINCLKCKFIKLYE